MTIKLSLALGVVLATALPAMLGYDPGQAETSAQVQTRLMWVYGGLPALMMAAGTLFLLRFPITRERHACPSRNTARSKVDRDVAGFSTAALRPESCRGVGMSSPGRGKGKAARVRFRSRLIQLASRQVKQHEEVLPAPAPTVPKPSAGRRQLAR
jgi:hypothetical protein